MKGTIGRSLYNLITNALFLWKKNQDKTIIKYERKHALIVFYSNGDINEKFIQSSHKQNHSGKLYCLVCMFELPNNESRAGTPKAM